MSRKHEKLELFTVREIAEQDKVSEKTVWRDIERGALKVLRLGPSERIVRITAEHREAYRALRQALSRFRAPVHRRRRARR